jgi:hypothetical protein
MEIRTVVLAVLLAASSASAAPHVTTFEQAQRVFDYQAKDAATQAYVDAWIEFNNAHHLDEKGNCYAMPGGSLVLILEIDAKGKVVGYFADQDNERSRCWRKAYFGVRFPRPPYAPIYHRLVMG